MKLDVVRRSLMAAFVTLFVFAAAAITYGTNSVPVEMTGSVSLLGDYITQIQIAWPLWSKAASVLLIFLAGSALGRMTVRYGLYPVRTYLAIPLYGFFACGVFISSEYLVQYLASAVFVLSMGNFYTCFRPGNYGFGEIFRGAFFLGILPLIYTPTAMLAVIIPLVVLIFKRSFREFLVAAAGYSLPIAAVGYLNWCFGGPFEAPFIILHEAFITPAGFSLLHLPTITRGLLGISNLLFAGAALAYFLHMHAAGSKPRLILLFNLLLFLLTGAMFFLPCASATATAFTAVPLAVVLPLLLTRLNRWAASLLYLGIILLCVLGVLHLT